MKYFVLGAMASGFLLYGMSMLYGATGSLDIGQVFKAINSGEIKHQVLVFGLVFVVAGLAFKLGVVPFHMWVPDVYQGAPTAITALIGGAPKLAAFAMTIRLLVDGLLPLAIDWQQMLAVLAIAEQGGLLNAPDVYMDKIAVGPGYPEGVIDLARGATANVAAVAAAKGVQPNEIIVCVLDRPRHEALITELRGIGCGIMLIPDGDVAGVIATTNPDTGIDLYMGSGGAPEGVLAAAALRCVGGQMQGKLLFRNEDERGRARRWGIEDLDRIYGLTDMAKGDCIFAATGVTDGSMLDGVKRLKGGVITTQSVVMRASSGTIRWVSGEHRAHRHA
jgi:fructose-1,6-bisphosphatase/sedoheptulose 1,7-bisphosphatase-like protein